MAPTSTSTAAPPKAPVANSTTKARELVVGPTAARRQPAESLGPRANRTIARILEATREVLLINGYAGTTIDEIAKAAGISRGSFYTYFPTKRDVLLAVGAFSASESGAIVDEIADLEPSLAAMKKWVDRYFVLLETHGAFAFAWTQAARQDDEIRVAGIRGHLRLCARLGNALAKLGGIQVADPISRGLVSFALIERAWDYISLYAESVDEPAIRAEIAQSLWASTQLLPEN